MALIVSFEKVESDVQRRHGEVNCGWRYFDDDGSRLLQLDTYGSSERQSIGKQSQTIQLDEEGARQLLGILLEAFPNLDFSASR